MLAYKRPNNVPKLNLQDLPDYVSSSDEDGEEGEEEDTENNKQMIDDEALQQ